MRARNVLITLLLLIGIFLFAVFRKWREPQRHEALNRAPEHLRFYAFALCRMKCMALTEREVKAVLQQGVIHLNRSSRYRQPCPLFAVQARVRGGYYRVVFEQCRNATYVVNCYDLSAEAPCDCTNEYKPKNK